MFAFLKSRLFLSVVGLTLFALFVWFGLPYFRVHVWEPFASDVLRLTIILVVAAGVIAWEVWKRVAAKASSQQLVAAVVAQGGGDASSREAQALRERFDEATARLKQNRRDGHTLYELPWYVIIGAPGSGKTTALAHSGLQFPVDQRTGRAGARGVGGTRNCDWWFTNQAVFIDTAGRYTTQDSDPGADSAAWKDFLGLLKKYRQRRPINGVLLAISAQDLLTQSSERRDEHIDAARRRLAELNDEFGIQLPVYLLVTKCDLIAGFTEYFDDLTQEERAQVWGVTFPYAVTKNSEAAQAFPEELDALVQRLNERLLLRVEDERDVRRRTRVFGFPQQVASLRDALTGFVSEVFSSTRFERTILLRGVYFTSGTQEGTPIDRLLGSLSRRFALAPEAVVPAGKGKAFFIQRLLQEVVIPEAGLAGVNRRIEVRKAASQFGAYAAMILAGILGLIALTVSFGANRAYLRSVDGAVQRLTASPPEAAEAPVERLLPRLDAVRAIFDAANAHRDGVPWHMRWGLYQGSALGEDAREAYVDVLSGPLLSRVASRIRTRILESTGEPLAVYQYLKGYLLLLDPRARDGRSHLRELANAEWQHPGAEESDTGPALLRHFHALLDESSGPLRAIPKDAGTDVLISGARRVIRNVSIAELAYRGLKRAGEDQRATSLEVLAGPGAPLLRRKDGVSLSSPISYIFTVDGFDAMSSSSSIRQEVQTLADEQWVWGDEQMPSENRSDIERRLFELWGNEYIATWDAAVRNIDLKPFSGPEQTATALQRLSSPAGSPLRLLLQAVARHTLLLKPTAKPAPDAGASVTNAFKSGLSSVTSNLGIKAPAEAADVPVRRRVTAFFEPVRTLVAGEPGSAPIDGVLMQVAALQEKVAKVGGVGTPQAADPQVQADVAAAAAGVRASAADLPEAVGAVVTELAAKAEAVIAHAAQKDLRQQYQAEVAIPCQARVGGKYPVAPGGALEATLADFGQVFGHGGVFDRFYSVRLERLVEQVGSSLRWRPGAGDAALGPASMLQRFEVARAVRDAYFAPGSMRPEVTFRLTPVSIGSLERFLLDLDGQVLDYRNEAPRSVAMKWPSGKDSGVVATFFDRTTPPPYMEYRGAWGFFRWLEDVQVSADSETRHTVTLVKNAHRVELRVDADSAVNPFNQRALFRRFQCAI